MEVPPPGPGAFGRLVPAAFDASRWSLHYAFGLTPWELGMPHPELVRRLERPGASRLRPGRVLIPGCGRGHDALAFVRAGWEVLALDYAPQAVAHAWELLGDSADVVEADAFGFRADRSFDLLFDHTFLCAVPLDRRPDVGVLAPRVLEVGGRVVFIVYPIGKCPPVQGPPYLLDVDDVSAALGDGFVLEEVSAPIEDDPRSWPARRGVWRRLRR